MDEKVGFLDMIPAAILEVFDLSRPPRLTIRPPSVTQDSDVRGASRRAYDQIME